MTNDEARRLGRHVGALVLMVIGSYLIGSELGWRVGVGAYCLTAALYNS